MTRAMTQPEFEYAFLARAAGLPEPERELLFAQALGRRWRTEFAYRAELVGVEIEGGMRPYRDPNTHEMVERGRHLRAEGYESDCEKYNTAQLLGWLMLRFTPAQVHSGYAVETVKRTLALRRGEVTSDYAAGLVARDRVTPRRRTSGRGAGRNGRSASTHDGNGKGMVKA